MIQIEFLQSLQLTDVDTHGPLIDFPHQFGAVESFVRPAKIEIIGFARECTTGFSQSVYCVATEYLAFETLDHIMSVLAFINPKRQWCISHGSRGLEYIGPVTTIENNTHVAIT